MKWKYEFTFFDIIEERFFEALHASCFMPGNSSTVVAYRPTHWLVFART